MYTHAHTHDVHAYRMQQLQAKNWLKQQRAERERKEEKEREMNQRRQDMRLEQQRKVRVDDEISMIAEIIEQKLVQLATS